MQRTQEMDNLHDDAWPYRKLIFKYQASLSIFQTIIQLEEEREKNVRFKIKKVFFVVVE